MSQFWMYLQLGFEHIADLKAYDHILFVVVLCAVYQWRQWRTIGILVTAFTIGHSITLALAALRIIPVHTALIEFLIPVTILLTAIYNIIISQKKTDDKVAISTNALDADMPNEIEKPNKASLYTKYALAAGFGLIHGMGFSNYFSMLISKEQSLVQALLAFNIGIEIGQLLIVAVAVGIASLFINVLKVKQKYWILFISVAVAVMAIWLMIETKFW